MASKVAQLRDAGAIVPIVIKMFTIMTLIKCHQWDRDILVIISNMSRHETIVDPNLVQLESDVASKVAQLRDAGAMIAEARQMQEQAGRALDLAMRKLQV